MPNQITLTLSHADLATLDRYCRDTGLTREQAALNLLRDGDRWASLEPILKQMSATLIGIADHNARRDQQLELAVKVIQDLVKSQP